MVELRKRKAPVDAAPPPPVKKATSVKSFTSNKKDDSSANGSPATSKNVAAGDTITIDGFGGEIETNDGEKVTLKKLVDNSKSGVVLFTYPKASTPGCTNQACLFRDEFTPLTATTGYSIYGLSTDSTKSNTTFKTKQNLPYTLLCDPAATLISAIGMKKAPSGTTRGVFIVNKDGKVEAVSSGGPAATVDVVRKIVGGVKVNDQVERSAEGGKVEKEIEEGNASAKEAEQSQSADEDGAQAEVAAEVADSAQKLDEGVQA